MNNFFVVGLPRSRTAWLSTFFTGNNSFCYHEILRVSGGIDDAIKKLLNRKEMYVGNSDSSLPLWMGKVDHILQHSPIVIIERDANEVNNSLINLFGRDDDWTKTIDLTLEGLEIIKKRYNYISVDYNELDKQSCLELVSDFCVPNIPFDKDKFETLRSVNVSIDKDLYMRNGRWWREIFNQNADSGCKIHKTKK